MRACVRAYMCMCVCVCVCVCVLFLSNCCYSYPFFILLLFSSCNVQEEDKVWWTPQNLYCHVIVSDLESVTGSLPRVSQHPHPCRHWPCMVLGNLCNNLFWFKCFEHCIVLYHKPQACYHHNAFKLLSPDTSTATYNTCMYMYKTYNIIHVGWKAFIS